MTFVRRQQSTRSASEKAFRTSRCADAPRGFKFTGCLRYYERDRPLTGTKNMGRAALAMIASFALSMLGSTAVLASPEAEVERVLSLEQAPPGVVFEVVSGNPDALIDVVPRVSLYAERLRARFANLPVAVVTHGTEQFSLLSSEAENYAELHAQIQSLTRERGVDVHVCGTHASWRNKAPGDFPEYVDVVAAGPATVNDYRALGYIVIVF